jgi:FKBP-type peptidyl-prolyl cis-trans isomerase FkpA
VLGGGTTIAGLDRGVRGMKPGGKRRLVIPAELAYGKRGMGDVVPPGSDLAYEVELLEVRAKENAAEAPAAGGSGPEVAGARR